MRIALGVEYDGTGFFGWQTQGGDVRTVQSVLEAALSRVADRQIAVVCAGRTDAGVHAIGQVIHFDCDVERPRKAWLLGTNSNLPSDVSIRWVTPVSTDFHARFQARSRSYRYLIQEGRSRPALDRNRAAWHRRYLDAERMDTAARVLVGRHDFSAFRASECQAKSSIRQVEHIAVRRSGSCVVVEVRANAFLHHMVRIVVGSLMSVGSGERPPQWIADVLEARDRRLAGKTADACGLYLVDVVYDDRFGLPRSPAVTVSL